VDAHSAEFGVRKEALAVKLIQSGSCSRIGSLARRRTTGDVCLGVWRQLLQVREGLLAHRNQLGIRFRLSLVARQTPPF
jgi:hypothetical protein